MNNRSQYIPHGIIFGLALVSFLIFSSYLSGNNMGHDYALFLPQLIAGFFHYMQNGLFSIPWFSPSQCAGVPAFADLNNLYFSIPQFATFFMLPSTALKFTFFIFTFLGGVGFYKLMKDRFELSNEASLLASALFMFNTLFITRMLIGHLTFHSFMLTPWIAWGILKDHDSIKETLKNVIISSLSVSYMFYSGAVNIIIPVAVVTVFLGLYHSYLGLGRIAWKNYLITFFLSLMLVSSKLVAALNLMSNFPRDFYKLPGWDSFFSILKNIFMTIFFHVDPRSTYESYKNFQFSLGEHELEYSIGIIPLLIIIFYLLKFGKDKLQELKSLKSDKKILLFSLFVILLLPVMLNFYSEGWNNFLKTIPVIRNSSLMVRWFLIYIPIFILFSAKFFDKFEIKIADNKKYILVGAIIATFFQVIVWDKSYYAKQPFSDLNINKVWEYSSKTGKIIPIKSVANKGGGNLTFMVGESNLKCYQPIFGYRLEKLPLKSIREGSIELTSGEWLNFKNPACYVYPELNKCSAGDHFRTSDKQSLISLVNYTNYNFQISGVQKIANIISILVFIASLLFFGFFNFKKP